MELPTAGRDDRQALRLRLSASLPAGLAGVEGLEPPTPGFGDRCSDQLSYTPRSRNGGVYIDPSADGPYGGRIASKKPVVRDRSQGHRPRLILAGPFTPIKRPRRIRLGLERAAASRRCEQRVNCVQ